MNLTEHLILSQRLIFKNLYIYGIFAAKTKLKKLVILFDNLFITRAAW